MTGIFAFQCGPGEKSLWNLGRDRVSWFSPSLHLKGTFRAGSRKNTLCVAAGELTRLPHVQVSQQVSLLIIVAACPWIPAAPSSSSPNKCFTFNFIYLFSTFHIKKQLKVHHNKERKHKQERERKEKKIKTNPTLPHPQIQRHAHSHTYTGAQTQTYTYTHSLRKHLLIFHFFPHRDAVKQSPTFLFPTFPPLTHSFCTLKTAQSTPLVHQLSWNETYKIHFVAVLKKKTATDDTF